ncbi:GIY-YIG nuclease family protein [bacterium]|uniref:Excinuclease ABC subunit C n=2 Tax=Katanobacteria TaxID=422282 RepID=A0A2M7X0H6_UNCKA|nr:GIY-YIG nuclease family protein [bacterium]PIP56194.1 MAG: hypothetical protein COX05_04365 [candidate division WWE3 bacterium CG22_combo_CG10-13_8_21_14_all_39_12]PJA39633.1 MAG: hypothetical protein CO179_04815 [candidate division WWE3 bacterium CG_4_9_14_3_um_filter_39_7]
MHADPMLLAQIGKLPQNPGVYLFKDSKGKPLYIGKSKSIRDRVKQYFTVQSHLGKRTAELLSTTKKLDHIETETEFEALLLEADLIKRYRPQFNTQWKDDKRFLYIKICNAKYKQNQGITKTVENNIWPWVTVDRKPDDPRALYFGPFPNAQTVRIVLRLLRRAFPWCKYATPEQAKRAHKACFYSHIGLCSGICNNNPDLYLYWININQLVKFLSGKKETVVAYYKKKMDKASLTLRYEDAGLYRDTIEKLDYISQSFHSSYEYLTNTNLKEDIRAQEIIELFLSIGLTEPQDPHSIIIEGYDISNIGKDYTVGARVVFAGGDPDTSSYRRYKINHEKLPDDFAAMNEVLTRRLRKKDDLPDLLLIDGGKGQLSVVLDIAQKLEIKTPIVGLAKREETLVVYREGIYKEIKLPKRSGAVKLVQRIRDEAHRFAQNYHKLLRKKGFTL